MRTVAIRACNGRYLCAEDGGNQPVSANRDQVGEWETWDIIPLPPRMQGNSFVCLRSHSNGHFLCSDHNNNYRLVANRKKCTDWEQFQIECHGNQARFRAVNNGKYIMVDQAGNLYTHSDMADANETFLLEYLD